MLRGVIQAIGGVIILIRGTPSVRWRTPVDKFQGEPILQIL